MMPGFQPCTGPSIAPRHYWQQREQRLALTSFLSVGQTGLWDAQNNAVVAPVTGAYYININAATQPTTDLDVRIFVNGLDASIGLYSYQSSGVVSKSRAAIVMLNKGDRVTVVAAPGTGLYGDTNWPSSSFTGFLLYARQ
jgi:hypothetical protein